MKSNEREDDGYTTTDHATNCNVHLLLVAKKDSTNRTPFEVTHQLQQNKMITQVYRACVADYEAKYVYKIQRRIPCGRT